MGRVMQNHIVLLAIAFFVSLVFAILTKDDAEQPG
jgi:hypothetical protein